MTLVLAPLFDSLNVILMKTKQRKTKKKFILNLNENVHDFIVVLQEK